MGLVTGVLSHSVWKSGRVVSVPSLHRESTDSLMKWLCEFYAITHTSIHLSRLVQIKTMLKKKGDCFHLIGLSGQL